MKDLSFHWEGVTSFINQDDLYKYRNTVVDIHRSIHNKTSVGSDMLGWLDWPLNYDKQEVEKILVVAQQVKEHSEILLVIGVGGSYLGAKAVIDLLQHSFSQLLPDHKRSHPLVIFVGHHLSSSYIQDLLEMLEGRDVSINVISKSGVTLEPAIAFRIFEKWMTERYDETEVIRRIFVTTDHSSGALKELADQKGYQRFVVPNSIGGRFSVLTAVGLLPMAIAGIEIEQLLAGAAAASAHLSEEKLEENDAYIYATLRHLLHFQGKGMEILAYNEPAFYSFSEWWKQLFGESEGKQEKGIFPAAIGLTTDLHSLGQYVQDGQRNLFETFLTVETIDQSLVIEPSDQDWDGLNYLVGKSLAYINQKAVEGTMQAHMDGNVPCLQISIPKVTPYHVGYLIYFFEKACAMSGYLLGVNPFDQPGVEQYKSNMFKLLQKPGY